MRFMMAGLVGLLAWNLSITLIPRKPAPAPNTQPTCTADPLMVMTQQQPGAGALSQIYNDGGTLRVKVNSKWERLDRGTKIVLYNSFICLAQKQNLPMQLMFSENE